MVAISFTPPLCCNEKCRRQNAEYNSQLPLLFSNTAQEFQDTAAPKYLVAARKTKYAKPESANSLYLFGCNKDSVYKNISSGVPICVTHTYENEKAVAVLKNKNRYDIIPLQHCLSVL